MTSSIIIPVRWYNDIYESERFSSGCDICRFELISDKTRLLPFQFKRPKSPYLIDNWFLRKQCVDPTVSLLNSNDSLFTIDTTYWSKSHFSFINGKIKATGGGAASNFRKLGALTIGKYYDITIVVNEFVKALASSFAVTYDIGGSGVTPITSTGTITFKILATTTDFTIDGVGGTSVDYIVIESIKINEYKSFDVGIGDIELDLTLLNLVNLDLTSDLIQYCGGTFPVQIPCGKYYMIMSMADNSVYYSELITVKDFIPSQSTFTLMEWSNTCDLSDVIYQPIDGCSYKNRMYIDAELLKPEYPFKEEGEEDGNFKLNILFQKWEKKQALMVAKCPEFIVDSLTAIRLHDTITVTKSLRKKQIQVLAPIEVEKVEYENTSIFSDCATNVELNILLKDLIVDSTCCSDIELPSCIECEFTVDSLDTLTGTYYFGTHEDEFGLYTVIEGVYTNISATDQVVCVTDSSLTYINLGGEYWTPVPFVGNVVDTDLGSGNHSYKIFGYIYPNTYCKVHAITYDGDTSSTTTTDYTAIYTAAQLLAGIDILSTTFGVSVPDNGTVSFYIENFALNCDYGISNTFETMYLLALHPIVETWDGEQEQLSSPNIFHINNFIQGLDDDGILSEFYLLHVLAGLETDSQRLNPLIQVSMLGFVGNGGYTFDNTGFVGNGSDGYLDLNFNELYQLSGINSSAGVFIQNNVQENSYDFGVSDTTSSRHTFLRARTSTDDFENRLHNATTQSVSNSNSTGMFAVSKLALVRDAFKDGAVVNSSAITTTGLPDGNIYLGANNLDSVAVGFSTRKYQFIFIGNYTINQASLYARFMTLKTAIGF